MCSGSRVGLRDGWHGEPGCDGCPLRLEGSEDMGLFEVRSREVVEPRLFVAVWVLEDIREGLKEERTVGGV